MSLVTYFDLSSGFFGNGKFLTFRDSQAKYMTVDRSYSEYEAIRTYHDRGDEVGRFCDRRAI